VFNLNVGKKKNYEERRNMQAETSQDRRTHLVGGVLIADEMGL